MIKYIPLILTGVSLNAFAQILLKKGMIAIGHFSFSFSNILPVFYRIVFNPFIVIGLGCYVTSVGFWLLVLSRVDVSFAYPFLSVGYIITSIAGYVLFNENLSFYRVSGIIVICIGVILISRS